MGQISKVRAKINTAAVLEDSFSIFTLEASGAYPTNDWRIWEDSYGNKISIKKHLVVRRNKILYGDPYSKSNIKKISAISSVCAIFCTDNFYYFLMFGLESYRLIRYCINEKKWEKNLPPLTLPFNVLLMVSNQLKISGLSELDCNKNINKEKIKKAYISSWPPKEEDILKLNIKIVEELISAT